MSDNINNALDHIQDKINEYRKKTLEYYFEDGSHVIFEKYMIDTLGIIRHKVSNQTPGYGNWKYNRCSIFDDAGKKRNIRVGRAVASTFLGKPPSLAHTADHIIGEQKKNDTLENIRWFNEIEQNKNRIMPETNKSAFYIVKDGTEKTAKEWVAHLNASKVPGDREYTPKMIRSYVQRKQHGFAYKKYPDLLGENWREIPWSKNKNGRWEISNMNRVKYITAAGAENVLGGESLYLNEGYPAISINRKQYLCHVLTFMMFRETEWKLKKDDEMVLHEKDDKMDFRPHTLYLGTQSDNTKDSHNNGKRDGTVTERMKCASYRDGVFEKNHDSQTDAAKYIYSLKISKTNIKIIASKISLALSGDRLSAYKRTWKRL
ncbi:hypothetical protein PBCVCVG1_073R [Paramecium bursaria Chlorella virus CVG-1]|nr:hypothetical protein PBCVCVG1_073R [Paramecium bursaria Chlorella virus CVG-1]